MTSRFLLALTATLLVLGAAWPALAQAETQVRIREVDVETDGGTQLVVSVTGANTPDVLDASAFSVTENGDKVELVEVKPLFDSEITVDIVVALVLDLSGSTVGEPLAAAKQAAKAFVNAVTADGIEVMLVTFGDEEQLVLEATEDAGALVSAIDELEAPPDAETAFFDGVALAADQLAQIEAQRNILVFTDGADTASQLGLPGAIEAALAADSSVNTVFLQGTSEFDPEVVDRLADATGGTVLSAASTDDLAAAFDEVVARLASQYVLSYESAYTTAEELSFTVSVSADGVSGSDSAVALNTRIPPPPDARAVTIEPPGFFGEPIVRDVGIYGAGATVALVLGLLLVRPSSGGGRLLRRSLEVQTRGTDKVSRSGAGGLSATAIGKRAVSMVDQLPKPEGSDEKLQLLIDRAYWPLRSSEFILICVGSAIGGLAVGWGLFGSAVFGVLMLIVGAIVPYLVLKVAVQRRQSAFESMLPDTLQLMAGSLKAGYGMLQAIDTVEKESGEPMSTEFRRVLTEARLGLAVEDALDAMAERVGSEDFKWVVVAINIQRKIGGNLAELLETVAETLRQREQVRRQIKVLSAEGRLSAAVLVGLPFGLVGYLMLVNPEYLRPLFTESRGQLMIAVGLVLMGIGIAWMRKIIKIEV